ncbi:hypothetical protein MADA3029_1220062 [Vibrio nigripulchritudo MADA3029]|uniref:DUF4123 domain-containing protein n=1 Tax=Vibrio nigripulchritudo TaxID=28173 RepID=UPI0003B21E31|nr:DUF4123 domain-containing protein [Vibrio nigripulchritudo]CCN49849.1 hypothetical protein VIBNIMADA3020_800063 [Vibrio nigripulchritudo MADA3020]CCN55283.1 hypothetical protein VIBNIMADA3021_740002 [Vibrio nigripulchritudo MADA3021]CCN58009.1 hypothetical protein MADA3029_1220062 [Vibrio nigripulchritudo MADA3029]
MMPESSNDDIDTESVSLFDIMSNTTGTLYLLVDKQLFPKLDEFWNAFSGRHDARSIPLYRDTEYHQLLDFSPLLIEIENGNPGETLFHWLLEQGDAFLRFGLVGVYPGSLNDIQIHWAKWLTCIYPNGDQAILRFYDFSVLQKLWRVFTSNQQSAFSGQHDSLYAPHSPEKTQALVKISDQAWLNEQQIESQKAFTQLTLTQIQYDALFYEKRVNALACKLHEELAPRYGWLLPYVNVRERFWEGLSIAIEKFPDESSLAHETYAMYRFYLSSHFDDHPDFQKLLRQYPLRESIKHFHERSRREPDLLNEYKQEGWLGIEGRAELSND